MSVYLIFHRRKLSQGCLAEYERILMSCVMVLMSPHLFMSYWRSSIKLPNFGEPQFLICKMKVVLFTLGLTVEIENNECNQSVLGTQ